MRTKEEDREYQREYRKRNPDTHNKKITKYNNNVRTATLVLLGNKCKICGFNDPRALQIDHINGGGSKELKMGNQANYLNNVIKSIINNENKYQLLCANCNWIKRSENKEATGRPKLI